MNEKTSENLSLRQAIVRAIVFFDLFDYPLTAFEIWQYLTSPASLADVKSELNSLINQPPAAKIIKLVNGFYFLNDRADLLTERAGRYKYSNQKFKIARRVAKLFRLVPAIKFIAISNIIGAHNLRDASDIDFFIITSPRRLWLTRFFCAGLMKFLNLRPRPGDKRNKICLSFYITSDHLNLKELMINQEDIYFIYWLAGLVPILDRVGMGAKFIQTNAWLKDYLPNFEPAEFNHRRLINYWQSNQNLKTLKINFLNKLGDGLDIISKKIQLMIMPKQLQRLMNQDTRVIVQDDILKLYLVDRRQEFLDKFNNKLKSYENY